MQQIMNYYSEMHDITRGKAQHDRTFVYGWKRIKNNVENKIIKLITPENEIKQIYMMWITKLLVESSSPSLS